MGGNRKRMEGFSNLLTFSEAIARFTGRKWIPAGTEKLRISGCAGRISSGDIYSEQNSPSFDRSAVDGYAVVSTDVSGANEYNFIKLRIDGEIEAGPSRSRRVIQGHAYEIYTGGELPLGSDAVVMAEYAERVGDAVNVYRAARKYENVSRVGEDIAIGQKIIGRGEAVRAQHIAAGIAVGVESIDVYRILKMGIISTGNEIMPDGDVKNTTQPLLASYFSTPYMSTHDLGVVPDEKAPIRDAVKKAINLNDMIVVTGGTSLGAKDLVADALDELGDMVFGGVMIRPGRTISVYDVGGKPVFSVSGLPVAALISLEAFLDEYLRIHLNMKHPRIVVRASMTERVANRDGMRSYLRVRVRNTGKGLVADPLRISGSGILSSLLLSNGITVIPDDREGLEEGEQVDVTITGDVY